MKRVVSFLRLIRPFNLIMIAFTLYTVRFCFVLPVLMFCNFHLQLNEAVFAWFSISFIFVAAAGYIINDYYDIETDSINRPGRVIIGNVISSRLALVSFWILNIVGISAGFVSGYYAGVPLIGVLFLVYFLGLWLYSYKLKSSFLIGNLLIAAFLGMVPLASVFIEVMAGIKNAEFQNVFIVMPLRTGAWTIACFAFLSSLVREIVKDMEDLEGDRATGCRTMPVVSGIKKTRVLAMGLLLAMIILLGVIQYYAWASGWHISFYYIMLLIQLPCIVIAWKLRKALLPGEFHNISSWLKIVMVTGISYLFIFTYESYTTIQFIRKFSHYL
jgi:4-hydroxybenzoate polyprenyltransferase